MCGLQCLLALQSKQRYVQRFLRSENGSGIERYLFACMACNISIHGESIGTAARLVGESVLSPRAMQTLWCMVEIIHAFHGGNMISRLDALLPKYAFSVGCTRLLLISVD